MLRFFITCWTLLFLVSAAKAQCVGQNLIALLPSAERDGLYARAHAEPYAVGNIWQATRGTETLYLLGTFHLDDPRHADLMRRITPLLTQSKMLLVEAGQKEEAELQQKLASDPAAMMAMAGSGLAESLPTEDWEQLKAALLQRGIPGSIAEKLRPWFISMLLSIPPCALQLAATGGGLDKQVMAAAQDRAIPIRALEPFDTALKLFDGMSLDEQIVMIRNALAMEQQAEDFLQTTADAYFAGESRLIWEYSRYVANSLPGATPEKTDAEFALSEEALMSNRNRNWITGIETALQDGTTFAAFGALHLSGKEGVLTLLKAKGFTIKRLDE